LISHLFPAALLWR